MILGIIFIPMSIIASMQLSRRTDRDQSKLHLKLRKLPKFIVFFAYQSVKGGVDTASRAFSLNMKLHPEFIHYPIQYLPAGTAMNLFINLVSLLPGSVSVVREPSGVLLHVLITNPKTLDEIYECERAVCQLFGIETRENFRLPIAE